MEKRRKFLKTAIGFLVGIGFLFSPFYKAARIVYGKGQKIILPRNTKRSDLTGRDPRDLDTRNLEITPLKDFGTMGESNYEMNMETWRLEVTGRVGAALTLTYAEILARSPLERNVLLICPGVFANYGRWKGISMGKLLEEAKIEKDLTHVTFYGPKGSYQKSESFPLEDVLADRVFLAYGVNGQTLPKKHGFPLRVVAEGFYGSDWVKYVTRVEVG